MMKQRTGKQADASKNGLPQFAVNRLFEGSFIIVLTAALFVLLSLLTYNDHDPGFSHAGSMAYAISNAGGRVGAYIADGLYLSFGYLAHLLPLCFAYFAWMILVDHRSLYEVNKHVLLLRTLGLSFMLAAGCGLLSLSPKWIPQMVLYSAGGLVGSTIAQLFIHAVGIYGAALVLVAMMLVGVTWFTGLSWIVATEAMGFYSLRLATFAMQISRWCKQIITGFLANQREDKPREIKQTVSRNVVDSNFAVPKVKKRRVTAEPIKTVPTAQPVFRAQVSSTSLPSLDLLDKGKPGIPLAGYTHQELEALSREVEQHLLDFGIQADVVEVHPGPVITRFELQLAAGIKVSKLAALAKDLARSLSVSSVRVVEIIPGKTLVGIELPNQNRAMVCLSDVLTAEVYQQALSPLTLALGVDIAGHPMVVDLAKMPHLLVAGTTGSGKSVGINAMILSLLFKSTPEQVRLILVDPKMLELSVYDGIPHLLTPVVTDMKEAASSLRWCVAEMERRYRLMSSFGVRNLAGFNAKVTEAEEKGQPLFDPLWKPTSSMDSEAPTLQTLPYVVVVIDELADMMMVVGKKVETLIARIAQKARAAGIHLILATQRPSVDVLTGLIKSNIPTRISFQVSSKIDSRTILDQQGAEQLLGHGDMLFLAPGTGAPLRVHGAFVDDREVHRIADDWRARGEPEYIEEITQHMGEGGDGSFSEEGDEVEDADPLYDQAVEFVIQTRKASISAVQRRFKIGYNRAARLVEEMERTGVVGPLEGGMRDVHVASIAED